MQHTFLLTESEQRFLQTARSITIRAYATMVEAAETLERTKGYVQQATAALDGALEMLLQTRGLESATLSDDCSTLTANVKAEHPLSTFNLLANLNQKEKSQ